MRVVLDTNILVSALVFGGTPEKVLKLVLEKQIESTISPVLLAELLEVLVKKFNFDSKRTELVEKKIQKFFRIVHPKSYFQVLEDEPDNRLLEAAADDSCDCIVTGDKEVLRLGEFKGVKIITVAQFLEEHY